MIETRKHYSRSVTKDRSVVIEVVYDDEESTQTYVSVSGDTGKVEFLLALPDLRALTEMLSTAQGDFPPF